MSFPTAVGLASGDEKQTSSNDKGRALGVRGQTEDGRVFRWTKNGATGLAAGVLVQGAAANSSMDAALDIVGGTSTGVNEIKVVVQATVTRDQYKDGWVTIDTAPGLGMYKIAGHDAASSGATLTFKTAPNDPLREALSSGTTKVGLRENPYKDVIVTPTTVTGPIVGVTQCSVAAEQYFWAQEDDWGIINTDTAPVVNTELIFAGTSAGHADIRSSAANDQALITVGVAVDAGAGADKLNFAKIKLG